MLMRILHFVRLPLLLILIWAVMRFLLGPVFGVPYEPRGNAMFSIAAVTLVSCLIYGAMSGRVGGFGWLGAFLIGVVLGLFSQILIFTATLASIAGGIDTYFIHYDALNLEKGTPVVMGSAMAARAGGLFFGSLSSGVVAIIGRALFSSLAPRGGNN